MQQSAFFVVAALALFTTAAQASLGKPGDIIDPPRQTAGYDTGFLINSPIIDGIYKSAKNFTFTPSSYEVLGQVSPNSAKQAYTFPKEQPFHIQIKGDQAIIHPIVNADEVGNEPDVLYASRADVEQARLTLISDGDKYALYSNYTSQTPIEVAGRCKFYVEQHFHFHVDGKCASSMSAGKLAAVGFYSTSCANAEMKVWGGGPGGCGHVAYWTGRTWSSRDFVGDPGRNFHAIGCYARNGGGSFHMSSNEEGGGVVGLINGDGNG